MNLARLALVWAGSMFLLAQPSVDALADRMLARLGAVQWNAAYTVSQPLPAGVTCQKWMPYQMALQADDQWSYHCAERKDGIIKESFFYVFGEPPRTALLRADLRPEDESPELTAALQRVLDEKVTQKFGAPTHEPEMMEIGFRHLRYGQPVAGQHWHSVNLDYFLHSNQWSVMPMGMRKGVELIVFEKRLMEERARDDFIHQVYEWGFITPDQVPFRSQVLGELGAEYVQLADAQAKTEPERKDLAQRSYQTTMDLLRQANGPPRDRKALLLLAANYFVEKLANLSSDSDAALIRPKLRAFGVKLGGQTHDAGLAYDQDLLRRVWREFPDTEAGEMAFVELQQRGWYTGTPEFCPPNPDLFREVITRGEAFLAQHPEPKFRKEVLFTLAEANESWWSIAHAPANDDPPYGMPYPRADLNKTQAAPARERAIRYYRQLIELAPESPEAASAGRRLPRLELGLDTGQRRFFCFYD